MYLRIAEGDKEPLDTLLNSDDAGFPDTMPRIIKMIPVVNIIYNYWSENNVQLDTVFESLKNCDALLPELQSLENHKKRYANAKIVNHNEELGVIAIRPLKEMLIFYKDYRDKANLSLTDSDLICLKEYFYEFVRKNEFPERQGRLGSVSLYENLGVAAMMNKRLGRRFNKFCEAELVETNCVERHDMGWLTDIRPTCIFKEFVEAIKNYWEGNTSPNPKTEWLFSGKYILREL